MTSICVVQSPCGAQKSPSGGASAQCSLSGDIAALRLDMDMNMDTDPAHSQSTRLNKLKALTPNFFAVALSVLYAFGGKRREVRLSKA